MRRKQDARRVSGQLRSASGMSSKVVRDQDRIEAVVEVLGAGRLTLSVDSGGGYLLRACPEGDEAPARDLLAVGVIRADGIVAVHPREAPPSRTSPTEAML